MVKLKSGFQGERAIIIPSSIIEEIKQDEFGSLLHISYIGYYPKASFHFRYRTKDEAMQYVFIYCVEGSGWFELDKIRHKVLPNVFFILPKGKAHTYGTSSNNPWTIYWLHFDGTKASFFSEGLDKPTQVAPEKDSRIEERLQL
ncbi:MAG: AraC family ligand binding domain-containing protein, partial [Salinivirgaceae bacterium]|nr:AraC family ligand binding domain-containing protein [Salinivirgaceae bacterium]